MQIVLTLGAGGLVGFCLRCIRMPGGLMVGSIMGAAAFNIFFQTAYVPHWGKLAAQMIAGAFIAAAVQKDDLLNMRRILRPAIILLCAYLAINVSLGLLIAWIAPLSLPTALFGGVPGGISDIPLIAADMGANAPEVAILQFARLLVGIGCFPSLIGYVCRHEPSQLPQSCASAPSKAAGGGRGLGELALTALTAGLAGLAGAWMGFPAGTLVMSMVGVMTLKLVWGKCFLPKQVRYAAQILSGAYIGCSVGVADLLNLRHLVLPALVLVSGYSLNCFFCGWALHRWCGMSRKVAMLASVPAGASDMALISMDLGVQSPDLVVLQIMRLVVVSSIFPQVMGLILRLYSG